MYPNDFQVDYIYTLNGELKSLIANGIKIWECNQVNELGHIEEYTMNGKTSTIDYDNYGELESMNYSEYKTFGFGFDDFGNMEYREDEALNLKEKFFYDEMNRLGLVEYYVNDVHQSTAELIMGYDNDGLGNIISKTGVGDQINYGEPTGSTTPGPNALTSIHGFGSYEPDNQVIDYTVFNKVSSITQTLENDDEISLDFKYGFDDQRRVTVFENTGDPQATKTKLFFGEYEEVWADNEMHIYNYIYSPTGLCAIDEFNRMNPSDSARVLWHVNTDHLGSIAYMWDSDDPSNFREYSFSTWGIPRNPSDWTQAPTEELINDRGFTGHEHLTEFELIDMNGRVYDPILGRFLSIDPYVQMPDYRDGFNRYAYCLNNPLIYTDPSGEFISSFMYLGYKYLTRPALDIQNLNFSQFGQPTAQNSLEGLSYLVNSYISVPGIIPGGLSHAGIEVGFNGIGNLISGKDFFDDWEIPAIYGFVSGAYSGYRLSDAGGLNYWWGTDESMWGNNRGQWSLAWWEKPTVYNGSNYQCSPYANGFCVHSCMAEITNEDQFYWMSLSNALGSQGAGVSSDVLEEYLNFHSDGELFLFDKFNNCSSDLLGNALKKQNNHLLYIEPGHGAFVEKVKVWEMSGRYKIFIDPSAGKYVKPITNRNYMSRDFLFYLINNIR